MDSLSKWSFFKRIFKAFPSYFQDIKFHSFWIWWTKKDYFTTTKFDFFLNHHWWFTSWYLLTRRRNPSSVINYFKASLVISNLCITGMQFHQLLQTFFFALSERSNFFTFPDDTSGSNNYKNETKTWKIHIICLCFFECFW